MYACKERSEWTLLVALYKVESALMCSIDFIAYSMQNQLQSRSSIHWLSVPQSTTVLTCFGDIYRFLVSSLYVMVLCLDSLSCAFCAVMSRGFWCHHHCKFCFFMWIHCSAATYLDRQLSSSVIIYGDDSGDTTDQIIVK